ncbi:hypothetical protein BGZ93_009609 [Podila epicladia]|nr:hypothetical protein BGZ93_009609 [Podila epicladia]
MYDTPSQSLKRKSSYDDISPLAMKTRTGIGLEEEIVYALGFYPLRMTRSHDYNDDGGTTETPGGTKAEGARDQYAETSTAESPTALAPATRQRECV